MMTLGASALPQIASFITFLEAIMQFSSTSEASTSVFTTLDWVAWVLVIVGAINWGLIGLMSFDLVAAIFGSMTAASRVVYVLVGMAGLYFLSYPFRRRL